MVTKTTETYEQYSLKGWSFTEWFKLNKDSLKIILSGGLGIATGFIAKLPQLWSVPLGVISAAAVKIILDTYDYWSSK